MFVALLPTVLFYVTHEAQVSVRLASAEYGLYAAQIMTRRVRAFRWARTPLRTYLWTLVVGPTVVLVLMLLNVALWRERERDRRRDGGAGGQRRTRHRGQLARGIPSTADAGLVE
jgi:hypothetical protein